jgi:trans-2,3-dihydro-3-hydroxyanthranilate isomerase
MTTRVPFCFVDVFATRPLTGNPLSPVTEADTLAEPQMRAIAREFNQSETTFLLRPSLPGATWRLRSFTPIGAEVFGAGHNALGAWLWLAAAGAGHLLVPARDRGAVDRAAPDALRLAAALRGAGGEGCYLYSRDPVDASGAVAYARFFNPVMGISEDPATGTAAGPLVASGQVADGGTVVVEQGHAVGRPSQIQVTVSGPRVRVGGSGLVVAEGTLTI